ncbi:hypothetical protein [Wolbachia endosymbiont (group A) of Cheilosia soror]|uniref:hypothetical protein n=1 Tax=Wolbachia endosymbiont (group A) of Cheilosia soror TaxID=2953995 RepID=UPI0021F8EEEA|nr:hypothetical protein [Wolbachia endosymbiont (group A) of Cheilosia soror]
MGGCCKRKQAESTTKKLVSNFKSSLFCGTKRFLTFNLAFLSYLEYSLHHNTKLKEGAAFAMKRNTIPFLEMIIIVPLVCLAFTGLLQCALVCAALMIATCFTVRTFNLREKLLEKQTGCPKETVNKEFKKDTIKFPIFDQNRKHIEYNSPNSGQPLNETSSTSLFVKVLLFPLKVLLKVLQSCIMLSLAAVELLETVPSFCVDLFFDRSFESTQSNMQRFGHLLYANVRNLVPITKFDECVANFIGTPKVTCCSSA